MSLQTKSVLGVCCALVAVLWWTWPFGDAPRPVGVAEGGGLPSEIAAAANQEPPDREQLPGSRKALDTTKDEAIPAFLVRGTTSSYTQDSNLLKLPAFAQVNAFVAVRPLKRVQVSVNANNLFDTFGFTEAEEGAIPGNGIVRARSINGRTISASLKLDF